MFSKQGALAVIDPDSASRILVFGDIHGDLPALERGLEMRRPDDLLIFLGDYADRGPRGVEVIEGVHSLMSRIPDKVIALMGNHEDYDANGRPAFTPCTLIEEADRKRGSWESFFKNFTLFTDRLSLAAILPGYALFAHGGIGPEMDTQDVLEHPVWEVRRQLLWGDPTSEPGEYMSYRGVGRLFGPDVSEDVLNRLGVKKFIRSHEPRKANNGPAIEHEGRVITTSATGIYGGRPFVLVLDTGSLPQSNGEVLEAAVYLDSYGPSDHSV
jgi:hypothetical protein